MLLRQKLNMFIALTGLFAAAMTYFVSVAVLENFLSSKESAQRQTISNSIQQDIEVFDRLLLLIEQRWEDELELSLSVLAQELSNLNADLSQIDVETMARLRDKYKLSDLHLINKDLVVYASTFDSEVGLDMTSYGDDYIENLRRVFNNDVFFTHRVSLSTANGNLKKYAYYSQKGSDIIINGDIDVKTRLSSEKNNRMVEYLFGDYVDKLIAKYESISSIDLFILSKVDQWSLFNPGVRIEQEKARRLYNGNYRPVEQSNTVLEHVDMQSYRQVGFKAFLQIDFNQNLITETKTNLRIYLLLSALLIVFISFALVQYITKKLILDRFTQLLVQVKEKQTFTNDDIKLSGNDELSRLSEEINGMMLRIKRQEDTNKWLTGISQQDSLTNLANRRGFDEKLFLEWNKARLSKNNLSIIMIDVDFFKQYNDYYGHVAGDKCLQTLANVLASQLSRSSDFLARYGGEEFVCVLPDTNEDEALKMCNAMLASVSALNMVHEDSAVDNYVSISLGCLTVNGKHSIDVDTLLQQVDKRLYQAKSAGRNQISSATYL